MSLLQRIEKLETNVRDQVVSAVLQKYANSLEFQSYMCLSPDIENRPWDEASDPSSDEHGVKAKMLMDEMLGQLQQKKLETSQGNDLQSMMLAKKIEQNHSYLQQTYGENPVRFVNAIRDILSFLKMVIEEKTVGIPQSFQDESDSLMESDQPVTSTKQESIQQELNSLLADSMNNEKQVKDIEQLKEQYVIKFQEISNNIAKIEFATNVINQDQALNPTEKSQQLSKLKEMKNNLEQELTSKGEELLVTKRKAVLFELSAHMQKVSKVQEAINGELQQWCWEQQRSLCGWPQPPSLDGLQGIGEMQGEILWRLYQNVMQMDNIFRPVMKSDADIMQMDSFRTSIIMLLDVFLRRAFVITEQPPQVLKKVTKFGARLRLLVGGKLKMHPPEVACTVVTEKDINKYKLLTNRINKIGSLPNNKNILNNKKTMEYQKETNVLEVQFKNLSLLAADRQGGKNREAVTDEKSAVLFSASLNLGKETFQVFALSAPVCLTVHGNQAPDAEATVFWDNAFADKERTSLEVPEEVPWPCMAEALSNRWKLWNETGLTHDHLLYLGQKLFPDATAEELQNRVVTRQLFSKDHLQHRQMTFWQWFYGAMDVVKRNMVNEWKKGAVAGFLSKQQSRDQLLQREPGTFLLRFSDGEVGGVTVPYVTVTSSGQIDVWNLRPWTNKDFSMRKLSDRMKDIEEIKFLYPDQKPKYEIFTCDAEEMPPQPIPNPEEYVDTELATRVKGSNPVGLISSPGRTPFAMDQMEPHFAMFAGSPQSSVALDTDLGSEQTIESAGITNDELNISTTFLNSFQNTGTNIYDDLTTLNVASTSY